MVRAFLNNVCLCARNVCKNAINCWHLNTKCLLNGYIETISLLKCCGNVARRCTQNKKKPRNKRNTFKVSMLRMAYGHKINEQQHHSNDRIVFGAPHSESISFSLVVLRCVLLLTQHWIAKLINMNLCNWNVSNNIMAMPLAPNQ